MKCCFRNRVLEGRYGIGMRYMANPLLQAESLRAQLSRELVSGRKGADLGHGIIDPRRKLPYQSSQNLELVKGQGAHPKPQPHQRVRGLKSETQHQAFRFLLVAYFWGKRRDHPAHFRQGGKIVM